MPTPLSISLWNLFDYQDKKLVMRDGTEIAYKLGTKWEVREWSDEGFYRGKYLWSTEAAIDMSAWLNNHEVSLA